MESGKWKIVLKHSPLRGETSPAAVRLALARLHLRPPYLGRLVLKLVGQNIIHTVNVFSERKSAGFACVLDYSGEHNIPMPTNPNGFFQAFPCYMLLRASSLTLDVALPKIRYSNSNNTRQSIGNNSVFSLSFGIFSFSVFSQQKRKKSTFFISKQFFIFFSLLRTKKRKRSKRKEMSHCFLQPYGCGLN